MNPILIIEDDNALAEGLVRALSSDTAGAQCCSSLKAARAQLENNSYSLILLDINLPDGNGFDFLMELKEKYDTPVIILTANDMESDIVAGLESGADDYITKPFSLAILRARVNAQFRKRQTVNNNISNNGNSNNYHNNYGGDNTAGSSNYRNNNSCKSEDKYVLDDYIFDFKRMEFSHAGASIELSKTEQKLLHILTENAGSTLSRSRLIDFVWTDGAEYVDENALSVAVKRLRDKLSAQDYIRTVYGVGYVWEKSATAGK